jgi:demethylmenaquinone methyltransferase/2-methoxy-6-polyprenyl-1,4-benzoquinol methylase
MSHDAHQKHYDELAAEWDLRFTAEDLEFLTFKVDRFGVKEGMNILDLGCGTGILFDILRRRVGKSGTVTGIDFSIQMALKAHRNFPFNNVNVIDADVVALPLKSNSFDMAVSFWSFPNFSDKPKAVKEIHRVLKPGSRLYIIQLLSSKETAERHKKLGGAVEKDEFPTEREMAELMNTGGFSDVIINDQPGIYLASAVAVK